MYSQHGRIVIYRSVNWVNKTNVFFRLLYMQQDRLLYRSKTNQADNDIITS